MNVEGRKEMKGKRMGGEEGRKRGDVGRRKGREGKEEGRRREDVRRRKGGVGGGRERGRKEKKEGEEIGRGKV